MHVSKLGLGYLSFHPTNLTLRYAPNGPAASVAVHLMQKHVLLLKSPDAWGNSNQENATTFARQNNTYIIDISASKFSASL